MDEIRTTLTNPIWWVTVVVAGIAINLAAAWILRRWDSLISRLSERYRLQSEKRREERERTIAELKRDPQALYLQSLAEINCRVRSLTMLVLGVLSFLLLEWLSVYTHIANSWIPIGILAYSGFAFFVGFSHFMQAQRIKRLIAESHERED